MPKGLRQYMCHAYPKRHVVSRDLDRPLVQLVMEDRDYRVAQGTVVYPGNKQDERTSTDAARAAAASAASAGSTSRGRGSREPPHIVRGINVGHYTYGTHDGTKAVRGGAHGSATSRSVTSPYSSNSGVGSSHTSSGGNGGILRRRTLYSSPHHTSPQQTQQEQAVDLLEVPTLTKQLLMGRMESGIGRGRQGLLSANSSGLSTTMDETSSRGFVSPLSTPTGRRMRTTARSTTSRSLVSNATSQSSLSSVGRAIWGSDENGRGGKYDSSPRKRTKGRYSKQQVKKKGSDSSSSGGEDKFMDDLALRHSKTMDESVSGGSDNTTPTSGQSMIAGHNDLISFDEEDPRNTSAYPVSPPLSEALLSIGSPFGAGESPRSPLRRNATPNAGTTPTSSFISASTQNTSTSTNSTNSTFFPDPSPYHPNLLSGHKPPSQMVLSSTMTSLRDPGIRLSAHGTQCQPRRIWIRLDIHAEAIQWRTETLPSSTIGNIGSADSNHVEDDKDADGGSSPTSQTSLITLGPIHSIALTDILFVDVGKTTAALSKLNSLKIPSQLCFSLLTSNGSLDLQAGSRLERDALISCFCLILDTVSFQYIQDTRDEEDGSTDRPTTWRDMNLEEEDVESGDDRTYVKTSPVRGRYSPRGDRYDREEATVISEGGQSTTSTNVFSGIGLDVGGSDVFVGLTSPDESKASI